MSVAAVLAPVFVQIALTFALLVWMGRARVGTVRRREVRVADVVLGQPNFPPRVTQIGNSFHNQLQLPPLFYALTALAMLTKQADLLFVVMAWIFVLTRLAHAYVHTGSNDIGVRFNLFSAGVLVLGLMWAVFAARILFASL